MSWMAAAVSWKLFVATILSSCGSNRCSMSKTEFFFASNVTVRKCCERPRMVTFILADFNFQPFDFFLDVAVNRLLAKFFQVRVFSEPREIAISKLQCLFERERGTVELLGERVAAREIVKHDRIFRLEAG